MHTFESTLKTICSSPEWEMEWLDMLSQLEYAGCRKIIKSVRFGRVDTAILNHISEEASHAFLLKALADKMGAAKRPWDECALSRVGWEYFENMDKKVSEMGGETEAYALVSWAVEQRVLQVYPLYLQATQNPGVRAVLTRILAQEERHGGVFDHQISDAALRSRVLELEAGLWERFVGGVTECVNRGSDSNRYRSLKQGEGHSAVLC